MNIRQSINLPDASTCYCSGCMHDWSFAQTKQNVVPGNVYGWAARNMCPTREHGRNSRDPPHIHVCVTNHKHYKQYKPV